MVHNYKLLDEKIPNFDFKQLKIIKNNQNVNSLHDSAKLKYYEKKNILLRLLNLEPNVTFHQSKIYYLKNSPLSEIVEQIEDFIEPIKYCFGLSDNVIDIIKDIWSIIFNEYKNRITKKNTDFYKEIQKIVFAHQNISGQYETNYYFIMELIKSFVRYGSNYIPIIIFLIKDINFELDYVITPLSRYYLPQLIF